IGLHGLATANRLLSGRLAPLSDGARLFFPDLLGHGKSPWPDCAYGLREHLDALHDWRSKIGLATEPVFLVGVSLGAVLGLHYAAREADWFGAATVKGVVSISIPAYPDQATGRATVSNAMVMTWL